MGEGLDSKRNFDRAVHFHRAGDLVRAAALYRSILAAAPTHFGSAHMLGVILLQQERLEEAERQLRRATQIDPYSHETLHHLGLALRRLGRLEEAIGAYDRAIAIRPDFAEAYCNRGNALRLLGRPEKALASYDRAVSLRPTHADAYYNRGGALEELLLWDDAAASYENAIALRPEFPEALNNLGNALFSVGRYDDALASFERALRLKPDYAEALTNRGNVLREIGQAEAALADHDRAIALQPASAAAYNNRAGAWRDLSRFDEAIADYERAIDRDPGYADARANLALTQLLLGDWARGLEGYELRFRKAKNVVARPNHPAPEWYGEALAGRSLLLYAEQGAGDVIQFIRFVPQLVAGGARVTVLAPRRLHRLLAGRDFGFVDSVTPDMPFDFQLALMSLPRVLGIRPGSVPAQVPYLRADARRSEIWRTRLGEGGFKVGIAWQGNPAGSIDNGRSIPLKEFAPLGGVEQVRLISLQKNFGAEQLDRKPDSLVVERPGFAFDDGADAFIDTAAMMANLDLVVTSDTSIAHLAGALGRPVWIALKKVPDWRWLLDRDDSPWYPTARLYRQRGPGDWAGVLHQIAAALRRTVREAARDGDVTTAA